MEKYLEVLFLLIYPSKDLKMTHVLSYFQFLKELFMKKLIFHLASYFQIEMKINLLFSVINIVENINLGWILELVTIAICLEVLNQIQEMFINYQLKMTQTDIIMMRKIHIQEVLNQLVHKPLKFQKQRYSKYLTNELILLRLYII